jgi:heat shock protein HtpX
VVEEIAIAGGIPKPAIYIIPDSDPNAFATGSGPEKASIAVTRGLLEKLDRDELQGVISHELSHVRNYDVRLMTVVAALAGAILLLSDWSRRGLGWGGGRRRSSDGEGGGGLGILFAILWVVSIVLAPIIAQIVSLAVSRQREYLADASGAELTRNPLALASALEKIAAAVEPTPSIKQGIAHLCIEDPRGRSLDQKEGFFANLFSTHPPIAKRIALLREMAYQKQ